MATPPKPSNAVPQDTLITIKVSVNDSLKKLKLPLKDLGANVLPDKLRHLLAIQPDQTVVFERFSDSAGGYITLDPNNPQVFKTLVRAAKAKLKLRLKATVTPMPLPAVAELVDIELVNQKMKHKSMEPVITRSPISPASSRESTAMDGRSIGRGIFQFRDTIAAPGQPLVDVSEAPLPAPFNAEPAARKSQPTVADMLKDANPLAHHKPMVALPAPVRSVPITAAVTRQGHPWSVHCNECDVAMANAHFHCNICDGGDYDLCENCVAGGKLCPGEGHWLIKRFVQNGMVISSTTERISPRKSVAQPEPEMVKDIPGAFNEETKTLAEPQGPTRTCNNCIVVQREHEFVTCMTCEDFDLCFDCHSGNKHGHHPSHPFQPATKDTVLSKGAAVLLNAGRNTSHNAICDGCDQHIFGVRHKCLNCPDWDYCNECFQTAEHKHPHHRFAPLYETIPEPRIIPARHSGIFCDGPLCKEKSEYIVGDRFKCAVCHDTDFCAQCEALPINTHNRTHPLIKFKTAVRNVSITSEHEDVSGQTRFMGDRRPLPPRTRMVTASTATTPIPPAVNAATQVQTVAEIKPTEIKPAPQPIPVAPITINQPLRAAPAPVHPLLLNAHFVQDTFIDGTVVEPNTRFTQIWTLRNPGPFAWPAGCSVRFVGGDNMLNLDNSHPAAVSDVNNASESNVLGRDVPMGEEVAFKITLKAPLREGKAISYWRMKTAEGTAFGHRLWCDVMVKRAPDVPEVKRVSPPSASVMQGQMMAARMAQVAQAQAQMAQAQAAMGPPPAYSDAAAATNIPARIAYMRDQQAKRREQAVMQQQMSQQRMQNFKEAGLQLPGSRRAVFDKITAAAEESAEEKARKDAARQRVSHIKAKILRAREEQAKAMVAERERAEAASSLVHKKASVEATTLNNDEGLVKEQDEKADIPEEKTSDDLEGSQMVFPKLDKESPTSSTYESAPSSKGKAAYVENEQGEIEHSATPAIASPVPSSIAPVQLPSPVSEDAFDFEDDIEVLSAHDGEESEDDGFQTDEEYDILDASDHETVKSI